MLFRNLRTLRRLMIWRLNSLSLKSKDLKRKMQKRILLSPNLEKLSDLKNLKFKEVTKRLVILRTLREIWEEKLSKTWQDGKQKKTSIMLWSRVKLKVKKELAREKSKNWEISKTTRSTVTNIKLENLKDTSKTRTESLMTSKFNTKTLSINLKRSSLKEQLRRTLTSRFLAGCLRLWRRRTCSTYS